MKFKDRPAPFPWGTEAWRKEYARLRKSHPDYLARAMIRLTNFSWRCVPLPGERCGARTRKGTPCLAKAMPKSGRCRMHGNGGPRTPEGKARSMENLKLRWKR